MSGSLVVGAAYVVIAAATAVAVLGAVRSRGRLASVVFPALVVAAVWVLIALLWVTPAPFFLAVMLLLAVVAGLRSGRDTLSLRCASCGNYYPSREHFASAQICRRCHEAAQA